MTTCGLLFRSWIISHTLLHRQSSWRTVTKETRRLSAAENIIGDLSIVSVSWFRSIRARRRGNWTFFRHGRCVPSSYRNYARLHLYAYIFRSKTDFCRARIFNAAYSYRTCEIALLFPKATIFLKKEESTIIYSFQKEDCELFEHTVFRKKNKKILMISFPKINTYYRDLNRSMLSLRNVLRDFPPFQRLVYGKGLHISIKYKALAHSKHDALLKQKRSFRDCSSLYLKW